MKKLIALLLIAVLSITALCACSQNDNTQDENVTINIGYMQGPTGMGMAKLIHDNQSSGKYQFTKFEDAQLATAALLKGEIDVACLPTNNASIIYNTKNESVQVLALNCLNSLYLMTKSGTAISSINDLEGKTIYTISNGTPKLILKELLEKNNVNATIKTEAVINNDTKQLALPSDLASALIAGAADIALVPEPVATAVPLKLASMNKDHTYTVALNVGTEWEKVHENPVAMGCVLANKSFVAENKTAIDAFLTEYESSISFMNNSENRDLAADYIVEASVLDAKGAAVKSLNNLGDAIAYVDGDKMKSILVDFYTAIGNSAIGGKLPKDEFYYKK